jgi:hypothetical protein
VEKIEERKRLSWKLSRMAERSGNTMAGMAWKRLSWKLSRMAERSRNMMAGRAGDAAQLKAESDDRKVAEYDGRKGRGSGSVRS